ncbi:MAG: hypothetical protein GX442_23725 [Candidatus Riflebacteria bacterium]|nr:hypothetical protein [Candidatus Riflebacteria bacterium]
MKDNPLWFWVNFCRGMGAVGAVLLALPFAIDLDMGHGGGASLMVGLMLLLTGLISAAVLARKARQADRILRPADVLAHWTGTDEDGDAYDVVISRVGIIYDTEVLPFFGEHCGLVQVKLEAEGQTPKALQVLVDGWHKARRHTFDLRLPIPANAQAQAQVQTVLATLQGLAGQRQPG